MFCKGRLTMKNNNSHDANYWLDSLIIALKAAMYKRTHEYFLKFIWAAVIVCGTISQWIHAIGDDNRFRKYYHQLARLGYFDDDIQYNYVKWFFDNIERLLSGACRIVLAGDDTPIKRYGNNIQGCGWNFHQSNGNKDSDKFYGYPLVVLSLVIEHPINGIISIPLMSRMYLSEKTLTKIPEKDRPEFKTKLELLMEMVENVVEIVKPYNKPIVLLFDRGYVSQNVFEKMEQLGVSVITRFKSNVNLYHLPKNSTEVRRGRPRKYGDKIKLIDVVNNNRSYRTKQAMLTLYGREAIVEWKGCIATSRLTNGNSIRIIVSRIVDVYEDSSGEIVRCEGPWGIFVSTDLTIDAPFILEQYSRRFSIEEMFKDLKEVCGLGKQQVRTLDTIKGSIGITLMDYTLVELWAWDKPTSDLTQNRGVWDDPNRRPSHRNKRQAMQFELKWNEFSSVYAKDLKPHIIQSLQKYVLETFLTT